MSLAIKRRIGQTIVIGDGIVIQITRVQGRDNVTVMIDAPQELKILRGELANLNPTDAAKFLNEIEESDRTVQQAQAKRALEIDAMAAGLVPIPPAPGRREPMARKKLRQAQQTRYMRERRGEFVPTTDIQDVVRRMRQRQTN